MPTALVTTHCLFLRLPFQGVPYEPILCPEAILESQAGETRKPHGGCLAEEAPGKWPPSSSEVGPRAAIASRHLATRLVDFTSRQRFQIDPRRGAEGHGCQLQGVPTYFLACGQNVPTVIF